MKVLLKISTLITIMFLLSSCNKEVIRLQGNYKDVDNTDSYLVVKMYSLAGSKEYIIDTVAVSEGEFEFYSKLIKPPVKLTFTSDDSSEFEAWVGEYGTKTLEIKKGPKYEAKVIGSFFCDELQRMNKNLYKMYIAPVKKKELEAAQLSMLADNETLSEKDEIYLADLKKDIKMAYRLRKKSILKTVRKNTQNPVALALMCQEYERLTSHQKKECFKYLSRTFADTGLNWQMKN